MLFQQTSAPSGWTKDTSSTNRALRLVSGTVGTGGGNTFTSVLNNSVTTGNGSVSNHTLTVAQMPAHTHTHTKATHPSGSGPEQNQSGGPEDRTNFGDTGTTSSVGGGQAHNHGFTNPSFNLNVAYTDVIIAQKD